MCTTPLMRLAGRGLWIFPGKKFCLLLNIGHILSWIQRSAFFMRTHTVHSCTMCTTPLMRLAGRRIESFLGKKSGSPPNVGHLLSWIQRSALSMLSKSLSSFDSCSKSRTKQTPDEMSKSSSAPAFSTASDCLILDFGSAANFAKFNSLANQTWIL